MTSLAAELVFNIYTTMTKKGKKKKKNNNKKLGTIKTQNQKTII